MSESFEVGEVAIFCRVPDMEPKWEPYVGEDCVVIIVGRCPICVEGNVNSTHRVLFPDGRKCCVCPGGIRKKKPPEEKSSWEHIERITHWRPIRETV